jgi:hypothetical protein
VLIEAAGDRFTAVTAGVPPATVPALAGITCVGEFHYRHHQADGAAYATRTR